MTTQPNTAKAQCVNSSGAVSCGANDTDGFFEPAGVGSITIDAGITVDDSGNGGNGAVGSSGNGVFEIDGGVTGDIVNNGTVIATIATVNPGGSARLAFDIDGVIGGRFFNTGTILGRNTISTDEILGGFVNLGTITAINTSSVLSVGTGEVSGGFLNNGTITAFSTGSLADGVNIRNVVGDFTNNGTITASAINSPIVTAIVTRKISGNFTNTGMVKSIAEGDSRAVLTSDVSGNFTNTGTITALSALSSRATGVETDNIGGNFTNSGTITATGPATGSRAVETDNIGGNFTNTGTIAATTRGGTAVEAGRITGNFINSGSITASNTGGAAEAVRVASIAGRLSNSGTISGTTNAIRVTGLANTNIENSGIINGNIVVSDGTNTFNNNIDNFGLIKGNIVISNGTNTFNNLAGALFEAGANVDLNFGLLTNDGTLSPGGTGTVLTSTFDDFVLVQNAGGSLAIDLDGAAATSDRINVTGNVRLAGKVVINLQNPVLGPQRFTILTTELTGTDNGLTLAASPVLQANLHTFDGNNEVVITTDLDFSAPGAGLNDNQTNLGENLNAAKAAGGGGLTTLLDAVIEGTVAPGSLTTVLDQLGAESFLNTETSALFGALGFADNLLSCEEAGGAYAAVAEGQCVWLQPQGRILDRGTTTANIGFEEEIVGLSGGMQFEVSPNWHVGWGFGYETGDLETDAGVNVGVDRIQAGLAAKYTSGPLLFAGSLSGGTSNNGIDRAIPFLGLTATSQSDIPFINAGFRAAYLFDQTSWYLKPTLDLNLTYLDRDAAVETGGGVANLVVAGDEALFFSASPSIELGHNATVGSSMARAYVNAGVTVFSDDDHAALASFAAAPAGTGAFAVSSELDQVFGDVEAGVTLFDIEDVDMTLRYIGQFSDDTQIHQGQLRASIKF
ncbi:MAG: autotransporter domain-containing protein [Pseudomonadota bacterium]